MQDREKLNIGIVGGFQNGKSTFVNCMLDDLVARTGGEGVRVTSVNVKYMYGDIQHVDYISDGNIISSVTLHDFIETKEFPSDINEVHVNLWKPILRYVNIVDTPGFNANDTDTAMALDSLKGLDAAILVVNNKALSVTETEIMHHLSVHGIPFYIIMNCMDNGGDSWNPQSTFNEEKEQVIDAAVKNRQFRPQMIENKSIIRANFQWFWYASEQYLQDDDEKREDLEENIFYYLKKKQKNVQGTIDKDFFRDNSNLLTVRRFFDDERNWGFPVNCIRWKSEMDKIFISWGKQLKRILR